MVLLAGSAWSLSSLYGTLSGGPVSSQFMTETVQRGPFRITLTEHGTLDSARNALLVNRVEGTTTIIALAPEGTWVRRGEVVCELDSSELVLQELQQQILVTQAQAHLEKGEKDIEIQRTQNASDLAAARLRLKLARLDLRKFEEGEYRQQRNQLAGEIKALEEDLARTRQKYDYSRRIARKGYRTQNDLQDDRIALVNAELRLKTERERLSLLEDFVKERTLTELRENVSAAEGDLERVELVGQAALKQFQVELGARQIARRIARRKLERLREQIAACTIVAPQDGEVVYVNPRRNSSYAVEAGGRVRARQALIKLPDVTHMKVDARIHESRISLARAGLPVIVRVDACPGEVYHGVVESISSVPLTPERTRPDLREYGAVVVLTDPPERVSRLRPGLTAELEIVASDCDDVLQVPVQSVVGVGAQHFAWVLTDAGPQCRRLETGETNGQSVAILAGIGEGEQVILNPRTHCADELNAHRLRIHAEEDERLHSGAPAQIAAVRPPR